MHAPRVSTILVQGLGVARALFVVSWLGTGCVPRAPTSTGGGIASPSPSTLCPFGLRGVRVSTDDVDGGIDVALTAFGSDVRELRKRAHTALEGTRDRTGSAPSAGRAEPLHVPSRVELEDVGNGVLVHARAVRAEDVVALRKEVHARIEHASSGRDCE